MQNCKCSVALDLLADVLEPTARDETVIARAIQNEWIATFGVIMTPQGLNIDFDATRLYYENGTALPLDTIIQGYEIRSLEVALKSPKERTPLQQPRPVRRKPRMRAATQLAQFIRGAHAPRTTAQVS